METNSENYPQSERAPEPCSSSPTPRRQKAKSSYSEKLRDPRWQKKRLEVFQRDKFKCVLCGDDKSMLAVHHSTYRGQPWDSKLEDLDTVCDDCHKRIEDAKKLVSSPRDGIEARMLITRTAEMSPEDNQLVIDLVSLIRFRPNVTEAIRAVHKLYLNAFQEGVNFEHEFNKSK